MAQFKLHGNKALIIQFFNSMPNLVLEEYTLDDLDDKEKESIIAKRWQRRILADIHKKEGER